MDYICAECQSKFPGYHYVHCTAVRRAGMSFGDWIGAGVIIAFILILLNLPTN